MWRDADDAQWKQTVRAAAEDLKEILYCMYFYILVRNCANFQVDGKNNNNKIKTRAGQADDEGGPHKHLAIFCFVQIFWLKNVGKYFALKVGLDFPINSLAWLSPAHFCHPATVVLDS